MGASFEIAILRSIRQEIAMHGWNRLVVDRTK
jgi:hypothetical protein